MCGNGARAGPMFAFGSAAARSYERHFAMLEAIQGVIDAYDLNEDIGPAIDGLVDVLTAPEVPG